MSPTKVILYRSYYLNVLYISVQSCLLHFIFWKKREKYL